MRVLLGVTGGIAAYKVAILLRRLREDGHSVRVVPTEASLNFVGRATWEALSGQPATSGTFDDVPSVEHVRLGQQADVCVIAPATADFMATMVHGSAKDLLSNALLAARGPVVVVPAMHTEMWEHAATQANVDILKSRGVHVMEPAHGRLTGADSGAGRLPEPEDIARYVYAVAAGEGIPERSEDSHSWGDLVGLRVVVSAGGTREPLDSVRFLGNRSTGNQGFALAHAAAERGADVTLVAANVQLPCGEGIERIDVSTAAELGDAVRAAAGNADVVIMAAAVADFRPASYSESKIKKTADGGGLILELVPNDDILARLVRERVEGQTIVGFAAETGDATASVLDHGKAKAKRKGADLLVINPVGESTGFGDVHNTVTGVSAGGEVLLEAHGSKVSVAHAILSTVASLRA